MILNIRVVFLKCSNEVRDTYGEGSGKKYKSGWDDFTKHDNFVVGDGYRISFWHDLWCGGRAFKVLFF